MLLIAQPYFEVVILYYSFLVKVEALLLLLTLCAFYDSEIGDWDLLRPVLYLKQAACHMSTHCSFANFLLRKEPHSCKCKEPVHRDLCRSSQNSMHRSSFPFRLYSHLLDKDALTANPVLSQATALCLLPRATQKAKAPFKGIIQRTLYFPLLLSKQTIVQ